MQPIVVLLQQYSTCGIYTSISVYNEVLLQIGQLQHSWATQQLTQLLKSILLRLTPLPHMLRQHDMHQRCSYVLEILYVLRIVICQAHRLLHFFYIGGFRPSAHG